MSKLKHPNIVQLLGITLHPLQMILEYIRKGNLASILGDKTISDNEFSWPIRLQIAYNIAQGMKYLHQCDPPIIHRDLRSPNIFINSLDLKDEHLAKVADFGMSEYAMPNISEMLPTWQWLAPEVINPKIKYYDEKSDIYSFSMVLWEISSRSLPFVEFEDFITRSVMTWTEEQFNDKKTLLQLLKKYWQSEGKSQEDIELNLLEFCLLDVRESIIEALKLHGYRVEGNSVIREDFQRQYIIEAIIQNNLRPSIVATTPEIFKKIIIECWTHDPDKRPTWSHIITHIDKCKEMYHNNNK